MKKIYIFLFLIKIVLFSNLHSQSFSVYPPELEFKDVFERLVKFSLVNNSNQSLTLDSLQFNRERYVIRYNQNITLPAVVDPGDSLSFDCTLVTYFEVTANEIHDSLLIFSGGQKAGQLLKLEIEFFEESEQTGTITGIVGDSAGVLPNTELAFILDGVFVLKHINTNAEGFYSVNLPAAEYTILASQNGYYDTYFGNTKSPFAARRISLLNNAVDTANIILTREVNTGINISGNVYDHKTMAKVGHGVVVVRKGKHTPTKINALMTDTLSAETYSAMVNPDGSFTIKNIKTPGYYYIQTFNNLYLPAYYSSANAPAVYWQQADSILAAGAVTGKDIYCERDSSYGGGTVSGNVIFNGLPKTAADSILNQVIIYAENIQTGNVYYYSFPGISYQFKIDNLPAGSYKLRAQIVGLDDALSSSFEVSHLSPSLSGIDITFSPTAVREPGMNLPDEFILISNYPNPFNPSTKIFLKLSVKAEISVDVFDPLGRKVAGIFRGELNRGEYQFQFSGDKLTSGVYFLTVRGGGIFKAAKMLLQK